MVTKEERRERISSLRLNPLNDDFSHRHRLFPASQNDAGQIDWQAVSVQTNQSATAVQFEFHLMTATFGPHSNILYSAV